MQDPQLPANPPTDVDGAIQTLKSSIMKVLDDGKALDVTCLDVGELCSFTDHMVLATGTSSRHVNALVGQVVDELREQGQRAIGVEGRETSEWVLVDYGDVVVHIMQRDARALYDMDHHITIVH